MKQIQLKSLLKEADSRLFVFSTSDGWNKPMTYKPYGIEQAVDDVINSYVKKEYENAKVVKAILEKLPVNKEFDFAEYGRGGYKTVRRVK